MSVCALEEKGITLEIRFELRQNAFTVLSLIWVAVQTT